MERRENGPNSLGESFTPVGSCKTRWVVGTQLLGTPPSSFETGSRSGGPGLPWRRKLAGRAWRCPQLCRKLGYGVVVWLKFLPEADKVDVQVNVTAEAEQAYGTKVVMTKPRAAKGVLGGHSL